MKLLTNVQIQRSVRWCSIIFFILYLSYLIYLTLLDHTYGRQLLNRSINIIPFKTILQYLINPSSIRATIINIAGNIVAFIPMGFLLPMISNKCKDFKVSILIIIIATMTIEILQYITGVGASDIDDLLLNTLGGILGYLIYKHVASKLFA